jgi:hypothetical protein
LNSCEDEQGNDDESKNNDEIWTERTGPVFPDGFNVETASPKDYFNLVPNTWPQNVCRLIFQIFGNAAMFVYNINHTVFFIHKTKNNPISHVILVFLDCPMRVPTNNLKKSLADNRIAKYEASVGPAPFGPTNLKKNSTL